MVHTPHDEGTDVDAEIPPHEEGVPQEDTLLVKDIVLQEDCVLGDEHLQHGNNHLKGDTVHDNESVQQEGRVQDRWVGLDAEARLEDRLCCSGCNECNRNRRNADEGPPHD